VHQVVLVDLIGAQRSRLRHDARGDQHVAWWCRVRFPVGDHSWRRSPAEERLEDTGELFGAQAKAFPCGCDLGSCERGHVRAIPRTASEIHDVAVIARGHRSSASGSCRPGYLQLTVGRLDPLAHIITVPAPTAVDLGAIQLGRREDGRPWTVRLRGSHTLIAGATGAGKGSVLWSLIQGLGPAIRDGLVKLWVLDPKGGMELAAGRPLFDRFAYDRASDMADVLEDAVAVMQARARRLMGRTRLHAPSVAEPLIAVVVDELASLTAYAERDDKRRISAALSLLLSQGRAVGVVVIAALQDPRKEVLPFRDLFPTRIALALVESEQTDLVLGRGARIRGADCSRIPLSTPGIGWVWCDGEQEPARVRAGWVSDDDIAAMVSAYTPGTPAPENDGDLVVIDLTDKARDRQGREP